MWHVVKFHITLTLRGSVLIMNAAFKLPMYTVLVVGAYWVLLPLAMSAHGIRVEGLTRPLSFLRRKVFTHSPVVNSRDVLALCTPSRAAQLLGRVTHCLITQMTAYESLVPEIIIILLLYIHIYPGTSLQTYRHVTSIVKLHPYYVL